jgi:cyclopropane fatty-acyl-phospholipid synthase-like methyltransferase
MGIQEVAEQYRAAFAEHGRSVNSIFIPKGRQKERFDALTRHIDEDGFSILDFGCGLGDLLPYLAGRFGSFEYVGADIVDGFVKSNRAMHPDGTFQHIHDFTDVQQAFDFVAISGTFNIDYFGDEEAHSAYVKDALRHLFARTRKALSVDFMHTEVDFRSPGSYHQDVIEIYEFARAELGKRIVIDQSYLPYEFAITVLR